MRFRANLNYKAYFIEKINRKSNRYRFIDVHDANIGIRACALHTVNKRPDINIGGNRRKKSCAFHIFSFYAMS